MPQLTWDDAKRVQFNDMVHIKAQQKTSRLSPYVTMEPVETEQVYYDYLGTARAREITGTFVPVQFDDVENTRRRLTKRKFVVVLGVDDENTIDALQDPSRNGKYGDVIVNALTRQKDYIIQQAMFADVYTGKTGTTALSFATGGGLTVDATGGLTYEKLLEMHKNFIDSEVGNESDMSFAMGITGDEHTSLMSELELTSGDYSRNYVVDKGKIQEAAGIQLIKFAGGVTYPVLPEVSGVRTSFCMAPGAVHVGIWKNIDVKIQERNELHNVRQIVAELWMDAIRVEEKLIQKVTLTA
jgi:hypothetical protein